MPRIYLDSNVFSNLRVPKDPHHMLLKELLEKYKHNITVVFSHAHIRDKKNDPSEMKFEDFRCMETLVQDNYISYHAIEQRTSFYLATPKMVFDDEVDESLDELLNFFDPSVDDDQQIVAFKNHLASALEMSEIKVEEIMLESGVEKEMLDRLFNGKDGNPTLLDVTKGVANLTKDMISDGSTYKNLRVLIENGLGQQLGEVKQAKLDLNDAFKNSFFQKTFVEFVKDSIHVKDKTQIPYYDFYTLSYHVLDILGISKEKLGKKNRYRNLLNDALHSYYARYCDVLVTNDKRLYDKSSILYHMYEVPTQIVTVEECNKLLQDLGEDTDQDYRWLFTKINYDLKHSKRELIAQLDSGGEVYRLEEISRYFNFFDVFLVEVTEGAIRYILCKSDTSYLSEPNFREMGKIIDRMVNIFGPDSNGQGSFSFAEETKGMKPIHRTWLLESITITLGQESLNEKFSLVLMFPS
jgi:predicted nucleic acid-binding protein